MFAAPTGNYIYHRSIEKKQTVDKESSNLFNGACRQFDGMMFPNWAIALLEKARNADSPKTVLLGRQRP
jgi:hypothetical protein